MKIEVILGNLDLFSSGQDEVSRLRDLIIELSVKGRLTVGDSSDIPADVLLASTALERIKLEKLKAIRARQTLPGEYLDKPYQIPKNWAWARLSDVGYELGQKTPENTFTYIDVGSIDPKLGRISDRVEQIEANQAPSRARKIVAEGTVIYSTVRPYLRNIAVVEKAFEPEPIASTAFGILHPFSGINNRYLFYWLRSKQFNAYVEKSMKGVAYPAINDEKFYSGYIPVPPTKEQDRIVAKVDELMALCDRLEAQLKERDVKQAALARAALAKFTEDPTPENLQLLFHPSFLIEPEDLKKIVLHLAIKGKLSTGSAKDSPASQAFQQLQKFSSTTSKERSPDRWIVVRLGHLGEWRGGGTPSKSRPDYWAGTLPWVSPKDMKVLKIADAQDHISPAAVEGSSVRLIPSGSLLMVVRGMILARCFPVAVTTREVTINQDMKALTPHYPEMKDYILIALRSLEKTVLDCIEHSTHGTCKLQTEPLQNTLIPIPPPEEQKRIVEKTEQLLSLIDQLEAQLEASRTTGEKLLEAMVAELTSA